VFHGYDFACGLENFIAVSEGSAHQNGKDQPYILGLPGRMFGSLLEKLVYRFFVHFSALPKLAWFLLQIGFIGRLQKERPYAGNVHVRYLTMNGVCSPAACPEVSNGFQDVRTKDFFLNAEPLNAV
jgi:hypothetical protein